MRRIIALAFLLTLLGGSASWADKADAFFDDRKVQEVRLYFDNPNWYQVLYDSHARDRADPYFPARFRHGDIVLDPVGVRFKGNSSFTGVRGVKKSFKIDFNEYNRDTTFLGLKKLNLNNGHLQPTLLNEKLFLDFASKYVAAMRAVHVRVYVNDVYWGLYIGVEQIDKTMMQSRFGDSEDGNLFEAGAEEAMAPGTPGGATRPPSADLSYLGPDPAAYHRSYQLKTNEAANDYSGLVKFIDILNNVPPENLPERLEPICDVENMLFGIALNILFVNLDSYPGAAAEYYLYHRQATGRFVHIHWDVNETFGSVGFGSPQVQDPLRLIPFWLPTSTSGPGGGQPGRAQPGGAAATQPRPLMEKLWAVESYKRLYLRQLARMLREGFDTKTMEARIRKLADLIRADVYADPNKLHTSAEFETGLTNPVPYERSTLFGLLQFVRERYNYLRPLLDSLAEPSDIRLNELMAVNTTLADNAGDYEPWIELHNLGPGPLDLNGFYLTNDSGNPAKWALPARKLADGEFLVLWLDEETAEGDNHANFRLNPGGGNLYLYHKSGDAMNPVDSLTYAALEANQSLIRLGGLGSRWAVTDGPTPGAANPAVGKVALYINEFMADNKTAVEDPDEPGAFEDWIEIYNPGPAAVDMGGMFLTDNLANPTKWRVPQGVSIQAGGYLVFWADNEPGQGPTHTNFQLAAGGEEIGLYHTDGRTLIDSVSFQQQSADVSFGRKPDGSANWTALRTPTPGAANN